MNMHSALVLIAATAAGAHAQQVSLQMLGNIYPLDMSADGTVIVGNDFVYETVRWTESGGLVNLGRGTQSLGRGAGTPDVSDDGTRVSASIITSDGQYVTQGVWTEGQGWTELMPPPPADGGLIDLAYGSAWGISGDGQQLVGLYWRPNDFANGGAHASIASTPGGVTDLGSSGGNSRANHANYDGSVIVGWDEGTGGVWQPTVWENGTLTRLPTEEAFTEATHVNPAGDIIGGYVYDTIFGYFPAALWDRTPTGWDLRVLGTLFGTTGPFGLASVGGMTPDGSIVVGYNRFNPSASTGFIWTEDDGMEDIKVWLTDRGVTIPAQLLILDLTCISADGLIMAGIGVNRNNGFPQGFRIVITPACAADWNKDGLVNFFDVSGFIADFNAADPAADLNGDTLFNFFDVAEFIAIYNAGCP
jgi:uncharacterized membrane protein